MSVDPEKVEWVKCPRCSKSGETMLGVYTEILMPKSVEWCDLCCDCPEAEALGRLNVRPGCLIEIWHVARDNRPGFVRPGVDVRYVLAPTQAIEIGEASQVTAQETIDHINAGGPGMEGVSAKRVGNQIILSAEPIAGQGSIKLEGE